MLLKEHRLVSTILRNGPDAFIHIISDNHGLKCFAPNKLTTEFNLVRKASANPIGVDFVTFAVNAHIQWFDLSVFVKGSNDGDNPYRYIVVGIAGNNLCHYNRRDNSMGNVPTPLSSI